MVCLAIQMLPHWFWYIVDATNVTLFSPNMVLDLLAPVNKVEDANVGKGLTSLSTRGTSSSDNITMLNPHRGKKSLKKLGSTRDHMSSINTSKIIGPKNFHGLRL